MLTETPLDLATAIDRLRDLKARPRQLCWLRYGSARFASLGMTR
jgi:hypothetical protein